MSQEDNIIIIGAGASGIAMGCQLQKLLGFTNFEIYEKGNEFGGTWYVNTYPGCGCDVPSHFYSFSFEKNPDWSELFPLQLEIHNYMVYVAKKYNLPAHTHFYMECLGAEWNQSTERWTVQFKNLKSGENFSKTCKFLILGTGLLSIPNPCPVPGIENFKGPSWHSARWNHQVDLTDKNVVVIGNGCSATQFVPVILPKTKSLLQSIRSPHWVFWRPNWKYSNSFKWIMRHVPGAIDIHRFIGAAFLDAQFTLYRTRAGQWIRNLFSLSATRYMKSKAPQKYHDLLIPKFEVGAKRRVFDTGYLECLHNPKMTLSNDAITQIKEKSILTKSGKEHPVDVIVYANGFQVHEPLVPIHIKGKNGEELRSRWKNQGGARAYMGSMVSGYPNMFIIIGPNATGHYSLIHMAECTVNFAIRLMKPFLNTGSKGSIEVTEEAEKKDVAWVQNRLKDYVWGNSGEGGWFVDKKTGHNGTMYPHHQFHYWLRTLRPVWSDFKMDGAKKSSPRGIYALMVIVVLIGFMLSWLLILRGISL